MRVFELKSELTAVMYRVLIRGVGGKGYSTETMRIVVPVLEQIEKHLTIDDVTHIGTINELAHVKFSVQENTFDLINKVVKSAQGLNAGKFERKILELEDFLKTVPSLPVEVADASK